MGQIKERKKDTPNSMHKTKIMLFEEIYLDFVPPTVLFVFANSDLTDIFVFSCYKCSGRCRVKRSQENAKSCEKTEKNTTISFSRKKCDVHTASEEPLPLYRVKMAKQKRDC